MTEIEVLRYIYENIGENMDYKDVRAISTYVEARIEKLAALDLLEKLEGIEEEDLSVQARTAFVDLINHLVLDT